MKSSIASNLPENFISISIIEDNHFLRAGWRAVLEDVDDFLLLGDYASCEAAFGSATVGQSDIILMDIGLPGISGIEGVRQLKQNQVNASIIMITVHDDDQNVFDAICSGAVGYLLKSTSPEGLVTAIRDAMEGGSPMTPNIARKVIQLLQKTSSPSSDISNELTEREKEVLRYLAEGKSYAAIGEALALTVHGVRYHLRNIYEKLHVSSRAEAVAKGLKHHWIQLPK